MKKLLCYVVVMWLMLLSGTAYAHANAKAVHNVSRSQAEVLPVPQNHNVATEESTTSDDQHADTCNHSHCGHGHVTGLLVLHNSCLTADLSLPAPLSRANWISSPVTADIERPKWLFTTPTVVNLLS